MAKASSSKKVQRAARAAASSRGKSKLRRFGFTLFVFIIVVLGSVMVVLARGSRDPVTAPTTGDHWHSAYSIYNCGALMPWLSGQADPDGIHSHGDSIIHIHPRNSSATGDDARTGVFFETMNVSVSAEGIFANNGEFAPIVAEDGCDGTPGVIKAARWNVAPGVEPELVEVFEDNFNDIRLLRDGEGFSFALVPEGEDPPPPDAEVVASLVGVGADIQWPGPDPLTTTPEDPLAPTPEDPLAPIPEELPTTTAADSPTTAPEESSTTTAVDSPDTTTSSPASEDTAPVEQTEDTTPVEQPDADESGG